MKKINKKLLIGDVVYDDVIAILAPMAGYTDLPFRYICEKYGCNLTITEMVNAKALCYNDEKTFSMLNTSSKNKNTVVQIFGSEVEYMEEAVKIINSLNKFSHIDINMGCPAPKIIKNGDGSALMKNPKLASSIVEAMKKNSKLPITVKIRKGFDNNNINAVEFSTMLEKSGADAITIHGRTRSEYYSGKADWDIIKKIKEKVNIPVIGNGDVVKPEDAKEMIEYTNCDAVLIGRGAQGNPFLFRQINEYFDTGYYTKYSDSEKILVAIEHYKLAIDTFGENIATREMRKQINCYLKGIKNSCSIKNEINTENDYNVVINTLNIFANSLT